MRRPSRVVDAVSFEKYDTGSKGGVLVTTNQFANRAEKQRLARSYGADLVDMEAVRCGRGGRAGGDSVFGGQGDLG